MFKIKNDRLMVDLLYISLDFKLVFSCYELNLSCCTTRAFSF